MSDTTETTQQPRQRGRAVPPLPEFTFVNGQVGKLRPVSQFTSAHIEVAARKKYPAPTPPLTTVDYGNGEKQEPNTGDPVYRQQLSDYQAMIVNKVLDAMLELGIEINVDQAALDEINRVMAMVGTPLEEISDKVAYIKYCCMRDIGSEMQQLADAIRGAGQPTEEAVAEQVTTFPGNLPRA